MIWASSQARSECVLFLNILSKGVCKCDWESLNPGDMPLQNIIAIREWKANERKSRIAPLKRSSSRSGVIFAGNIENDVLDKSEAADDTRKVASEPDLHKSSPNMQFKRHNIDDISCGKEDFLCNDIKVDLTQGCGTFSIEGHGNPQPHLSKKNHLDKTAKKSKEEIVLDLSSLFEAYSSTILKPTFGHLRDKSSNYRSQRGTPNESGIAQINSDHTPSMLPNMDQKGAFSNAIEILKPQNGAYEPSRPTVPGRTLTSSKSSNIQTNHSSCTATNSEKSNRTRQNFIIDPKSGIYLGLLKENDQSQDILHGPLDSNLPGMVDDIVITENRNMEERDDRDTHIGVLKSRNSEFFDSRDHYDLEEIMKVFDRPLEYGVNSIKDPIRSCSHISSLHLGDYGTHKNNAA